MIADDVDDTRKLIKKIVDLSDDNFEVVGEVNNGESVLKMIPVCKPDIVLMDINMPILNGLEATEKIADKYPMIGVIIMSVQGENEYLKNAMYAGAKGYIVKPINPDELVETVNGTYNKLKERHAMLPVNDEIKEGKTISYFSFKGGVGKSVLALNTAIELSVDLKKKVLLVDLDLYFGELALLTNKQSEKTIMDVVDDEALEIYDDLLNYFHEYNEQLHILYSPLTPEKAEYINKDTLQRLYDTVKTKYDVIIFDTGVNVSDVTLYALDISEQIYLVSSMELPAIKNTKIGLGVMKSLNYNEDKVKILINKGTEKYGITKKDVEGVFGRKIFAYIPEDIKIVRDSVNSGLPFTENSKLKRSKIKKSIQLIAKKVI